MDFTLVDQGDADTVDPATHCFALGLTMENQLKEFGADCGEGRRIFAQPPNCAYLSATQNDTAFRQIGHSKLLFLSAPLKGRYRKEVRG